MSYYSREGVSQAVWGGPMVVKQTTLPDGKLVSTVFLGIEHGRDDQDRPLIFETMVFPREGDYGELECMRYATEEDAREGHDDMCDWYWPQTPKAGPPYVEAWRAGGCAVCGKPDRGAPYLYAHPGCWDTVPVRKRQPYGGLKD